MTSEAVRKSMRGNKSTNTKPELLMRKALCEAGLTGYRLHWKAPGKPDIAWPGKKTALFVNGCFWHRCPHCKLPIPKSNTEYWVLKFEKNIERDRRDISFLEAAGWKVFIVWECQLQKKQLEQTLSELLPALSEALGKPLKAGRHCTIFTA